MSKAFGKGDNTKVKGILSNPPSATATPSKVGSPNKSVRWKDQVWYAENIASISEDQDLATAKSIMPIQGYINSFASDPFQNLKVNSLATKFPYFQEARGNGCCYFNASFAAILHACVGNPAKLAALKSNLTNNLGCEDIAQQIPNGLTRDQVNSLLVAKDQSNIVIALSNKLLMPLMRRELQNFIDGAKDKLFLSLTSDDPNQKSLLIPDHVNLVPQKEKQDELRRKIDIFVGFFAGTGVTQKVSGNLCVENDQDILAALNQAKFNKEQGETILHSTLKGDILQLAMIIDYSKAAQKNEFPNTFDVNSVNPILKKLWPYEFYQITPTTPADYEPREDVIYSVNTGTHFNVLYSKYDRFLTRDIKRVIPSINNNIENDIELDLTQRISAAEAKLQQNQKELNDVRRALNLVKSDIEDSGKLQKLDAMKSAIAIVGDDEDNKIKAATYVKTSIEEGEFEFQLRCARKDWDFNRGADPRSSYYESNLALQRAKQRTDIAAAQLGDELKGQIDKNRIIPEASKKILKIKKDAIESFIERAELDMSNVRNTSENQYYRNLENSWISQKFALQACEEMLPQWRHETDSIPVLPATTVKAELVMPMVMNQASIWSQIAKNDPHGTNPDNRANKFKVVDAVEQYKTGGQLDEEKIQETFIKILQKLSVGTEGNEKPKRDKLNLDQIFAIIARAKERGGIFNQASQQDGSYLQNPDQVQEINGVSAVEAKKFSAAFQKECEACGIYSGRTGGKAVGLRLTFIPDDVVEKLRYKTNEEFASGSELAGADLKTIQKNSTLQKIAAEKSVAKSRHG